MPVSSLRHMPVLSLVLSLALPLAAAAGGHEQITGPFTDIQSVTLQCLQCHAQQGSDILQSSHWTWRRTRRVGTATRSFAKKDGLTTFALGVESNPSRCLTCHISGNRLSGSHDPASSAHIDCLVCHDTTGTYRRSFGAPANNLDLVRIAGKVGKPEPRNCLTCHGRACGLTGLSGHDGLSDDIHLKRDGVDLACQQCHPSEDKHLFPRQRTATNDNPKATGCSGCHSATPHARNQLNRHAGTVACQTCHIPVYGPGTPALISWNWLTRPEQELFQQQTSPIPLLTKNGMTLATNVRPVYFWDHGGEEIYERGDKIDPTKTTVLLQPAPREATSQLKPFTALYGTQLYDTKFRYLLSPVLAKDAPTWFTSADWDRIASEGMNSLRLPYSGSFGFTATVTFRRLSHGVVPAALALDCLDCHGKQGRLPWRELGFPQDPWLDQDPELTKGRQQPPPVQNPAPAGQEPSPSGSAK